MRRFTDLFRRLDRTTRSTEKVVALVDYFQEASPADAGWAVWLLSGRRMKRTIGPSELRRLVAEVCDLPLWLVEDSYETVGDLGETLALLLDTQGALTAEPSPLGLAELIETRLLPLVGEDIGAQRARLVKTWGSLSVDEVFLFQKMITGGFRVGVARGLLTQALARVANVETAVMAQRLMGDLEPTPTAYRSLLSTTGAEDQRARPYPFFLAHALDGAAEELGSLGDWAIEPKWDGIRAQGIRRGGRSYLWSRGEEPLSEAFPELMDAMALLPDGTVVDGEILVWDDEKPASFASLQRRLGRRTPSARILAEFPVTLMVYDLLEREGEDQRQAPWLERRRALEAVVGDWMDRWRAFGDAAQPLAQLDLFDSVVERIPPPSVPLRLSTLNEFCSWDSVADFVASSRDHGVEGVMLKRRSAAYGTGRAKGDWWKWKAEPMTLDLVLVAAQLGHGRRANLYTDYTFALWDGEELKPVAKAYSGLSDEEIDRVDSFVRANITQRFGPVRGVKPELVFEIAFEGIQSSGRHKSGIALRFPRIQRWRSDLGIQDADTLEIAKSLL